MWLNLYHSILFVIFLNKCNQNVELYWREEFGSCHSFGVAMGLRGYGMCQMRSKSKHNLPKNAKGRLY